MEFSILGGGWVTANGHGQLNGGGVFRMDPGEPVLPKAKDVFSQRPFEPL